MTDPTPYTYHPDDSLNDVLAGLGYRTAPGGGTYSKDIVAPDGEIIFTGDAGRVWEWLRETGQIPAGR